MRYFIEMSFLGTQYHGWQRQLNALSIQEVMEKALSTILGEPIAVIGCGRTDTGVHAKQFFLHFELEEEKQEMGNLLVYQLNSFLPRDIAVQRCFPVADDVHSRFSASRRTYEYFIHQKKNPFLEGKSYYLQKLEVDLELWNQTAKLLLGEHDFSCFSKSRTQTKTNLCTIFSMEWRSISDGYCFEVSANRFLRNMVRALVGTFIDTEGNAERMLAVLESKKRTEAGTSVPGHGLYLSKIDYEPSLKD